MKTTVIGIHDALKVANLEYSAMSWNGFNLFGDEKSIAEARRLLHNSDTRMPAIEDRLLETNRLSIEWMDKHDKLLGFIQARPAVLKELINAAISTSDGDK